MKKYISAIISSLVLFGCSGGTVYANNSLDCKEYSKAAKEVMELRQLGFRKDVVVGEGIRLFPSVSEHIPSIVEFAFTIPEYKSFKQKEDVSIYFSAKAYEGCMKSGKGGKL